MDYSRLRTRPGRECGMKPGLGKQTHASQPKRWERVFLETVLKFKWAHKINVKVRIQGQMHRGEACPVVLSQGLIKLGWLCLRRTLNPPSIGITSPAQEGGAQGWLFMFKQLNGSSAQSGGICLSTDRQTDAAWGRNCLELWGTNAFG